MPPRSFVAPGCWAVTALLLAGCNQDVMPAPGPAPVASSSRSPNQRFDPPAQAAAEVSGQTERDLKFGQFVAGTAGSMVKKIAVGIENKGVMRVEIGESVKPEDTLALTKSLLAGARRDFPDKPIVVKVYDPAGTAILHARYQPGKGVDYQVAHEDASSPPHGSEAPPVTADPNKGRTEKDRKFATWAEDHGKSYLRYVQADLDRNGRLWFGVNSAVKPADVPELTKSLLEGARSEFPGRDLLATVFDPEGEKIGLATLKSNGSVVWSH